MLVNWMTWYYHCFLFIFKCAFQLYSSVFVISEYGYRYHVTRSQSMGLFFLCVVLMLSVTMCSCYYLLDRLLFHRDFYCDSCDYHWDFYGHSLLCELCSRLSVTKYFWFCKCTTPWMFPLLEIFLEYWIEHVSLGLIYVMSTFPTKILYRGVSGIATDCPCGVWCRELTTCLLYVDQLFGKSTFVQNYSRLVSLT